MARQIRRLWNPNGTYEHRVAEVSRRLRPDRVDIAGACLGLLGAAGIPFGRSAVRTP